MDAFRRGLGDTGYVEGQNVAGCDEKASFPAADEQQADQTMRASRKDVLEAVFFKVVALSTHRPIKIAFSYIHCIDPSLP
jgi:hypothetical protein